MEKTNRMRFADMVPGTVYEMPALVLAMEERKTKSGKAFMNIGLSDGESTIQANIFDHDMEDMEMLGVIKGDVANVSIVYREPYYNLNDIFGSDNPDVSVEDFIRTVPVDVDTLYDMITLTVEKTDADRDNSCSLAGLTLEILKDHKEDLKKSSAAKTIHHNILGGLIYHTARMVQAADKLCEVYDSLDRELLVCGAALHDIGKLIELKTDAFGEAEYTVDGRLFGHSMIGAQIVDEYGLIVGCPEKRVRLLMHLLASHHGKLEYGAVALPAVPEAACLHALDMMDSRVYQYEEAYREMSPGELSKKIYDSGMDT